MQSASPKSGTMLDRARSEILGIKIDDVTSEEALARIEQFVADGRPHLVTTVNPEFIVTAQTDAAFAQILNQADLNLADGQGLLWAARLLGLSLRERVTGVDTLVKLAELSARKGYAIYLLGAAEGVAEAAAQVLRSRFPGLRVAGTYAGSPAPEEDEGIVERIRRADPQLLFVAYGAPRQEQWIVRNIPRLRVPVAMGVGGAFDFISGKSSRAPVWVQRLGLEWLHRLTREPWRWRRMMALPRFCWLLLRESTR
jgi:N-acetylglucosaminyldiphosphoundecaprenol N-acetyl-beta-D-mannosaminyltransferase